ncbi:N-acetyltransferase [Paenibacillus sp. L3-i20]|uniref:GNAT family N-acetyltransferase n=1 Tax=Paenibacillus sp. L3-i20 TaxID=2905833 RepID=UPI001EDEB81A|nr:GNAT family N-acetyltransferase [Paenibacillus sp. L3-i20]GKU77444.1 N-acetyltransferase [Paenibacillus sp. L3-i20]
MEVTIKPLQSIDEAPMDLLLLADPSEQKVINYLREGESFIAEIEDVVVGIIVIIRKDPDTLEVINVAVREEWQGKGIGKKLLLRAKQFGIDQKVKRIEIGTGNSSLPQLALYQRSGYRIFEIWENYFIANYDEEIYENGIQCMDMIRLKLDL